VILISIDSLRGDRLGCYGYPRPVSPAIDRLAREGALFADVISQSSWTLPAHVSLFTSRYAYRHGVVSAERRADSSIVRLAEAFRAGGYTTAAVVSGPYLRREFGFDEGFDHFDESAAEKRNRDSHTGVTGPKTNRAVLSFLASNPRAPFFLFIHYWDVHYDYAPPAPYAQVFGHDSLAARSFADFARDASINSSLGAVDRAQLAALYDGEVRYTDRLIEDVLAAFRAGGALDRAIVAITSDHGDEFFEHGWKGHQNTLYDEVIRIPLIFWRSGGVLGGRVVDEPAELIGVYPTLLEAAGIDGGDASIDGRSHAGALRGEARTSREPPRPRMSETETKGRAATRGPRHPLEAIELAGRKLHLWRNAAGRRELYDLRSDPGERRDLCASEPEGARALESILARRMRDAGAAPAAGSAAIDPETEEELRSLGYID